MIAEGRLAWAAAYGDASVRTLYQAASLSKVVTAVAALRLVEEGRLGLDTDVNAELHSWHLPPSPLTRNHPVILRGLLSMTSGINVPGYAGYPRGAAVPDLRQVLDGSPPATSPPVRVVRVPGSAYSYSGGGYEIVQAWSRTQPARGSQKRRRSWCCGRQAWRKARLASRRAARWRAATLRAEPRFLADGE